METIESILAVYGIGIGIAAIIAVAWFLAKVALVITVFRMHDLMKSMCLQQEMLIRQLELLNNQVNNIDKKR